MKLKRTFFTRDALVVAPQLLGKLLVVSREGLVEKKMITEVEAYRGEEDKAAHVRFGKTQRNKVMYGKGGFVYVYLIYGMYWLINVVTGNKDEPQAVLIRGVKGISGPGRVGKWLGLDRSFYGEDLTISKRVWITEEKSKSKFKINKTARIGVDYAGSWAKKKWRFVLESKTAKDSVLLKKHLKTKRRK